jgi:hypothetical protein
MSIRSTVEPKLKSTPASRARTTSASTTLYIPPTGYETPWASSVYDSSDRIAGASNGLSPTYRSWKVNALFRRGAEK